MIFVVFLRTGVYCNNGRIVLGPLAAMLDLEFPVGIVWTYERVFRTISMNVIFTGRRCA